MQLTVFAKPSLQFVAPFEQGPEPGDRRHAHRLVVDPLQLAGGSKQPISDGTDESVTQNCVAPQLLHGLLEPLVPESLGESGLLGPVFAHPLIPSQELAPTMHRLMLSANPPQLASHCGGVAPQLFAIDAHTSVQDVEPALAFVPEPAPESFDESPQPPTAKT